MRSRRKRAYVFASVAGLGLGLVFSACNWPLICFSESPYTWDGLVIMRGRAATAAVDRAWRDEWIAFLQQKALDPYRVNSWLVEDMHDSHAYYAIIGGSVWHVMPIAAAIDIVVGLMIGPFALFWIRAFRKLRALSRQRRGCCAQCGYLLFRNESGVCPECGQSIAP